jgi:hypothetical protein
MKSEWWIWNDIGESGRGLIFRYYISICMDGLRKITDNLSQDSRSSCLHLNAGLPEYEAWVLTSRPRRSVPLWTLTSQLSHKKLMRNIISQILSSVHNSVINHGWLTGENSYILIPIPHIFTCYFPIQPTVRQNFICNVKYAVWDVRFSRRSVRSFEFCGM